MVVDSVLTDPPRGRTERIAALMAAVLASALGFIDASVVSVAMPAIRADLSADFVEAQWIANAYTLFLGALILVGGAAGDRFGLRRTLIGGIFVFTLASVACALALTPGSLIVARSFQGIGAAFMVPGSLALIARVFPAGERGRAIGLWATLSGLAAALGPIVGGLLIEAGGTEAWRLVYWINLPVALVVIIILMLGVGPIEGQRSGPIDWIGALLATLSLGSLAYALTIAANGVAVAREIGLFGLAGVILGGVFLWHESRAAAPMMPLSLFASRAFRGANLLTFFLYFALSGVLYFLPYTLIEAVHLPESQAGAVFLPFTITMALVARFAGAFADEHGTRLPIMVGSLIVAVSFATLALAVLFGNYAFGVLPAMAILGIGMGLVVSPLSTAVMTSAGDEVAGAASGVNNGVARVAGLFAVAALGVVAAVVYDGQVNPAQVPGGYGYRAVGLSHAADIIRSKAMVLSFVAVAGVTGALALVSALVAAVMLPGEPPRPDEAA